MKDLTFPFDSIIHAGISFWIWKTHSLECVTLSQRFQDELTDLGIEPCQFKESPSHFLEDEFLNLLKRDAERADYDVKFKDIPHRFFGIEIRRFSESGENLSCGILRDITLQRRTELSFAKLFERYESILQATLHGYLLLNTDGYVVNFNRAFASLIGLDEFDIHNKHLSQLALLPEDTISDFIEKVISNKSTANETSITTQQGENKHLEFSAHLIHANENKLIATFVRDISESHDTKQGLLKVIQQTDELNNLKSQLLNNVTHEFKSPLHRIIGLSEILNKELLDSNGREYISEIRLASERLLNSLTAMVELSKQKSARQNDQFSTFSLTDLVQELKTSFQHRALENGLSFHASLHKDEINVTCDRFLLEQVLKILIGNAVKFTEEGKVCLTSAGLQDGSITISVKDSGIGMDNEFLKELFNPFAQESKGFDRKHEGMGLGLSLVYRYIDILGAAIRVESEKGVGTEVIITLPPNSN